MHTFAFLAGLAASVSAAAIPQTSYHTPLTANITYYQRGTASNACNIAVANGSITEGDCHQIYVYGLGVSSLPNTTCTYSVFTGSTACGHDATEIRSTPIEAGNGSTCIDAGVYDGGRFVKASGLLICS